MEKIKKETVKKVLDVLSYIFVFIFFIFALISSILKFSGVKFNVFGSRYDVVLTDSMSEKNEKYKAFLEGHDDQFDAFDVVKSEKVESENELNVYDVVLYDDPYIGLNMHRIVAKIENGKDVITATSASIVTIDSYTGISFNDFTSHFKSELINFDEIEMKVLSKTDGDGNIFDFNCSGTNLEPTISKSEENGKFIFTYNVKLNTNLNGYLYITYKNIHDFDNELIINLKVNCASGKIDATSNSFIKSGDDLIGEFNHSYRFETRGDKADTSDGMITFSKIEGKVVKRIPKLGYFLRFMESIWGVIMFLLLGFLILGSAILRDHLDKKEKLAEQVSESSREEVVVNNETIQDEKSVKEPKVEDPKPVEKPNVEEPKVEDPKPVEEPEQKKETPQRVNGRFVPKGKPQKKINWPPKNTRWTKDNNPSINKKRAQGGDK